ncbi:MAG: UDP-N-acetylmuramate--L-alanine ligase [Treponemataceae bacterium]|nr:UDP-N-acetylmuramate--L-alanine ligase [Treponemataceae bacterium]
MKENESILPADMQGFPIHFVGIKGTGMAALVEICHRRGAIITGSDVADRFYTDAILEKLGIAPKLFSEENITEADPKPQLVIYSSAYKLDVNPDLVAAQKAGIPCILYTEGLGEVSRTAYSAGICGVHGKTTTTGICGTLIRKTALNAQILAGSIIKSFGDTCTTCNGDATARDHVFVAETCEYQRHFMDFHPQKILLTSVESDHQDYYPTYGDILDAFIDYICLLPENGTLIYCADDPGACEAANAALLERPDITMIPYGEWAPGDYGITFGKVIDGMQHFSLYGFEEDFALRIPGHHTVLDAVGALALTVELCKAQKVPVDVKKLSEGLLDYAGAKRRTEIVGQGTIADNHVIVIDDYGHHPTAVKTTLAGYRDFYKDRVLIADFMSHTYTRTSALLDEFASSFGSADEVILHKIFGSARETYTGGVTGKTLAEETAKHHKNVQYFEEILDAKDYVLKRLSQPLPQGKKGYLFVTMGAGDNYKLGLEVLKELKK